MYVSCNPESMAANAAELCSPQGPDGNAGGAPFKPVRAMVERCKLTLELESTQFQILIVKKDITELST